MTFAFAANNRSIRIEAEFWYVARELACRELGCDRSELQFVRTDKGPSMVHRKEKR